MKSKGEERTRLVLSMVEKVYYGYVGEHSQKQGRLGESRVDTSRLSRALQGEGEGERREDRAEPGAAAMRPKGTKIEGKQNGCTI